MLDLDRDSGLERTRDPSISRNEARLHRRFKSGARIDCSPRGQLARLYRRVQKTKAEPHQPRVYGHWTTPLGPREPSASRVNARRRHWRTAGGFRTTPEPLLLVGFSHDSSPVLFPFLPFLALSRVFDTFTRQESERREPGDTQVSVLYVDASDVE